jgi:glucosamine-6-phosphate deaminase
VVESIMELEVVVRETKVDSGRLAAERGAASIRDAIRARGEAFIILATGASQFELLEALVAQRDIDWGRVEGFHLDEYVGLPITHGASFRRYLRERFVDRVRPSLRAFHYIDGEGDIGSECARLGRRISANRIDVAFIGIGENGHLAFNDPPADFTTEDPYIVVDLDEACRRQQTGEGWFATIDAVPRRAISMSIRQILKSRTIVVTVPDARKANAVRASLEGPITPEVPASILRTHADMHIYLDRASAALLRPRA